MAFSWFLRINKQICKDGQKCHNSCDEGVITIGHSITHDSLLSADSKVIHPPTNLMNILVNSTTQVLLVLYNVHFLQVFQTNAHLLYYVKVKSNAKKQVYYTTLIVTDNVIEN